MTTKRQTAITIETHSLTIIRMRSNGKSGSVYCRNCETNVAGFRYAHAALIFRVDGRELECLSQNKQIHCVENGDLCANSLAAFFGQEIRCVED